MAFDAGTILGHLRLDNSGYTRGMLSAQSIASAFGPTVTGFVTNPILGAVQAGKQLFALWQAQAQAEARLAAVVRATGGAAGYTAEQLQTQASALQEVSGVGDEVILAAQSVLLTFKRIQGVTFDRTMQSIMDVSAVMGTDAKSAAVQLGKALNDPIKGLSALTRVGVSFTAQEEEMIKSLAKAGKMQEAQGVILDALEGQFQGAAEAVGGADGGWQKFLNTLGDFGELIGGLLAPALRLISTLLKPILELLRPVVELLAKVMDYVVGGVSGFLGTLLGGDGAGAVGAQPAVNVTVDPEASSRRVAERVAPAIAGSARGVQRTAERSAQRRMDARAYEDALVMGY